MNHRNRNFAIASVLGLLLVASPMLFAGDQRTPDQNGESASVVAHIPLSGPPATRMFTQYHNGHRYLYVDQGANNQVTVVDVSRPSQASVIQTTNWPADAAAGDVSFLGSDLAISQTPTEVVAPTPRTVKILDVVDAGQPAVLQTFNGVTSVLSDRARNLVYLTNADGLWIVRHRISQSGWASRHMCTSEDAINPIPDCY